MTELLLFNEFEDAVPKHTQHSIEDYLIRGWYPSGFLESVLTNDLFAASYKADVANRPALREIVMWFFNNSPAHSFGSKKNIDDWCADKDHIRTEFVTSIEKAVIWNKLNAGV